MGYDTLQVERRNRVTTIWCQNSLCWFAGLEALSVQTSLAGLKMALKVTSWIGDSVQGSPYRFTCSPGTGLGGIWITGSRLLEQIRNLMRFSSQALAWTLEARGGRPGQWRGLEGLCNNPPGYGAARVSQATKGLVVLLVEKGCPGLPFISWSCFLLLSA